LRIPGNFLKKSILFTINGKFIEILFHSDSKDSHFRKLGYLNDVEDFLNMIAIKINGNLIYNPFKLSNNFYIKLDGNFVANKDLEQYYGLNMGSLKKIAIIIPNNYNIEPGKHKVTIKIRDLKNKFTFKTEITTAPEDFEYPSQTWIDRIQEQTPYFNKKQQEAKDSFNKIKKNIAIVLYSVYFAVGLFLFGLILLVILDPVARQTDAGLGPAITLVIWICTGFWLLPSIYMNLLKKKK